MDEAEAPATATAMVLTGTMVEGVGATLVAAEATEVVHPGEAAGAVDGAAANPKTRIR